MSNEYGKMLKLSPSLKFGTTRYIIIKIKNKKKWWC